MATQPKAKKTITKAKANAKDQPPTDPYPYWTAFQEQATLQTILEFLPIHKRATDFLEAAATSSNAPNIVLFGSHGFPIELLWEHTVRKAFGNFTKTNCVSDKGLPYTECPYYIEINLAHPDAPKDTSSLHDFVQTIVLGRCLHASRHILFMREIDSISRGSLEAFKVFVERHSSNVIFICTTYHISNVDISFNSRFIMLRLPLPTESQVREVLAYLDVPPQIVKKIKTRNLVRALLAPDNELAAFNYPPLATEFTMSMSIERIRELSYKLCQMNIGISDIVLDLLALFRKRGKTDAGVSRFLAAAAALDHMLAKTQRGREPIYIELLLQEASLI